MPLPYEDISPVMFHGAVAALKVGGQVYAHMTDWSITVNFSTASAQCCGNHIDEGNTITGKTVSMSASSLKTKDTTKTAVALGMVPRYDSKSILSFLHQDAVIEDVSVEPLVVIGKVIGALVQSYDPCSGSARGLATTRLTWTALNFKDAAEL